MTTLEKRFEALERANLRWRWGFLVLIGVITIGVMMGQGSDARTGERVIWARRFEIRDQQARTCAVLSVAQDGEPGLVLRDQQGNVRIILGVVEDKPVLMFMDENGQKIDTEHSHH